jgi:hypothetical protein
MRFDRQCFLTFRSDIGKGSPSVRILSSVQESLRNWDSGTRVSPIFSVSGFSKQPSPCASTFRGRSWLLFLGPVHPQKVADSLRSRRGVNMWLSLGLYNVVLQVPTAKLAKKISIWAKGGNVAFERWEIRNGRVIRFTFWKAGTATDDFASKVAKLAEKPAPHELHEVISEYCPLMLATLSRAGQFPPASFQICNLFMVTSNERSTSLKAE